jgi:hypothetical protein
MRKARFAQVKLSLLSVALCLTVLSARAQEEVHSEVFTPTPLAAASTKLQSMPVWPPVDIIKSLLAGKGAPAPSSSSSPSTPVSAIDLLLVPQSASARLEPNDKDGGIVGGKLVLTDVQESWLLQGSVNNQ